MLTHVQQQALPLFSVGETGRLAESLQEATGGQVTSMHHSAGCSCNMYRYMANNTVFLLPMCWLPCCNRRPNRRQCAASVLKLAVDQPRCCAVLMPAAALCIQAGLHGLYSDWHFLEQQRQHLHHSTVSASAMPGMQCIVFTITRCVEALQSR
jgi:hypothetical protein